jgi:hypothetical protein
MCVRTVITGGWVTFGKVRLGWVRLGYANDVITHAQRVMLNGVHIVPPHDFEYSSHWYHHL